MQRCSDVLVKHGVEERGIVPLAEDEREELSGWKYLPTFTIYAAWNTNILTFSEGVVGPALFGLDFKTSAICIVLFGLASSIPPAYLATNGPRTGMRQLVQARYALGYWPAMVFGLINCLSFVGFLSLTVILGGQCLSLASASSMSWTVGIVVVSIISLLLSFVGLRALHVLSLASFPIILVLFIVLVGINGSNLHAAMGEAAQAMTDVNASGVLGYGASLIGFTVSYSSLASDYTNTLPAHTPRLTLFLVVFFGFAIPIIVIQLLGAASQLAAAGIATWTDAAAVGTPDLLYAMVGAGKAARFVMVLFCFSVVANTAPTIYSCGLSLQVAVPWLVRIPRYFLAFVVSAVYLPVAIVAATHFYDALENFLAILGYWTAIYMPPVALEAIFFRRPVGPMTYPIDDWDQAKRLPIGIAAVVAGLAGIPVITAGMAEVWWTGWIARAIPGGAGDVAFELALATVSLVFVPVRYFERRFLGR